MTALRAAAAFAVATFIAAPAGAAEIPWHAAAPLRISVTDQNLVELLRAIALENRIPIVVSEQVKGRVSGSFKAPPDKLFRDLAASYGLTWFFDGQVLHVSSLSELGMRQVGLPAERFARMRTLLAELGLDEARFPIRWFAAENHLLVFGPPSYLARVEELAGIVEYGPVRPNSPLTTRVFRLQHAWARDVVVQQGARESTLPGVAALLRRTLVDSGSPAPARPAVAASPENPADVAALPALRPRPPLVNLFGQAPPSAPAPNVQAVLPAPADKPRDSARKAADAAEAATRAQTAAVEADPRTNAVVVRDTRDRMALYESLIKELDVPVRLVEIEASIIDVDSDDSQRTGVAWRLFSDGHAGLGSAGAGTTPGNDVAGNIDRGSGALAPAGGGVDALLSAPLGFATSIVLGSATRSFSATLDLLVRKGRARVSSQPRVLTLDNNEALLENQQSFYVRVAGRDQANLFQVSAGLQLRVTPQITREDGVEKVKLLVSIEDGVLSRAQVDQVPVVSRKAINTQAVINAGDSLLVGGYVVEESFDDNQKVPLLGDVPVLGHLFKRTATTTRRVERMFLITPRLASPAAP